MATVSTPHLNFIYKLEGDVREVDVFKLAPTLLALGELIQEGNRELNPNGRQIGVNVKPFREGSFIVDLTVFSGSNLQHIIDLLTPHSLDQVLSLLKVLGLISGIPYGVVKAIRALKGKPKTIEEIAPGEFRYTSIEDKSITVDGPVHQLLSNSKIVTNIFKIYGTPLDEMPTVTDVATYLEGEEKSAVVITRDDVPVLREYSNPSTTPTDLAETVRESLQHDVYLNPKRGAFDGDPREWSFRRGDEVIVATIRDKEFLDLCTGGEYRLNHTDLLTVDLLERQRVLGTKVLKPTYEIIKVTSYIRGERQHRLDF